MKRHIIVRKSANWSMSGLMTPRDIRDLLDKLATEYEHLSDSRNKLEGDCSKLRDYIEAQVQQIQSLNGDFEKLQQDFVQRRAQVQHLDSESLRRIEPRPPPPPPPPAPARPPQPEENADQEWEVEPLIEPDRIERPLVISLVAEILDVSVICGTAFSPDGSCLAIGSDRTLRIYNVETDAFSFEYSFEDSEERPTNHIRSIAWTADSQRVLCGCEDGKVRVLSVTARSLLRTIGVAKGEVFQVAVSIPLAYFATVSDDGALTLFRVSDCEQLAKLSWKSESPIVATSVALSSDGMYLAVGYGDCHVRIWDYRSRHVLLSCQCHSMGVYAVRFMPNRPILISGSLDGTVKVWNWRVIPEPVLEPMRTFDGHSSYVLALAVDPTGDLIVSGSKDLTVIVSSVAAGAMLYRIKGHSNSIITVAFNPQGNMFCTGSGDHSVKIWSVQSANQEANPENE
jgi:WD40 repeat protein